MAIAAVDVFAVACLILLFVVGGPFGVLNDVANAVVGVLSAVLAFLWSPIHPPGWNRLAVTAAVIGAVVMTLGSALVIFEVTGYYLAGLVSALGAAFIGGWVLIANRLPPFVPELPRSLLAMGLAAGVIMLVGLLAVPGILARVDDQQTAPWYVTAAQVNWLGTYVLYPVWCFRLARNGRTSPVSRAEQH